MENNKKTKKMPMMDNMAMSKKISKEMEKMMMMGMGNGDRKGKKKK